MTDDDTKAMSVYCTLCRAKPYQPCRNEQGAVNPVPHVARLDNYKRLQEKKEY